MALNSMIKLVCGKSRAGKTTFSKRYDDVVHLDYCGGVLTCYEKAIDKIKDVENVILEGVYDTKERRLNLLESRSKDEFKTCIWIDTPKEIICKRHSDNFKYLADKDFEPPTLDEGWSEIIRITEYIRDDVK